MSQIFALIAYYQYHFICRFFDDISYFYLYEVNQNQVFKRIQIEFIWKLVWNAISIKRVDKDWK